MHNQIRLTQRTKHQGVFVSSVCVRTCVCIDVRACSMRMCKSRTKMVTILVQEEEAPSGGVCRSLGKERGGTLSRYFLYVYTHTYTRIHTHTHLTHIQTRSFLLFL